MLELKYVICTSQPPVFWFRILWFQIPHLSLELFSFPFVLLYSAVWHTAQVSDFVGSMEFGKKGSLGCQEWEVRWKILNCGVYWDKKLSCCLLLFSCTAQRWCTGCSKGCRWDIWDLDSEVWTPVLQKSLNTTFLLKNGTQLNLMSVLQHS